jgi:hypothetical protein
MKRKHPQLSKDKLTIRQFRQSESEKALTEMAKFKTTTDAAEEDEVKSTEVATEPPETPVTEGETEKKKQKRYNSLSIQQKQEVIDLIDQKKTYEEISKVFGISAGTVSNIKENRNLIQSIVQGKSVNTNMKQIKPRMSDNSKLLDERLYAWVHAAKEKNCLINGPKIVEKAKIAAEKIGMEFKGSNGWLESFKKRHNISFRSYLPSEKSQEAELNDGTGAMKDWEANILLADPTERFTFDSSSSAHLRHHNNNNEGGNDSLSSESESDEAAIGAGLTMKIPNKFHKLSALQLPSSTLVSSSGLPVNLKEAQSGLATFLQFMEENPIVREKIGLNTTMKKNLTNAGNEFNKITS